MAGRGQVGQIEAAEETGHLITGAGTGRVTVVASGVVVVGSERAATMADPRFVDVVPDLVIEVSSPSTRGYDLVRKRRTYEESGVPEYWFVDLDAERLERYALTDDAYGPPEIVESGALTSTVLEGLAVDLDELLSA